MKTIGLSILLLLVTLGSSIADVTTEQKEEFLVRFKAAVSTKSVDQYMALGYSVGIPEKLLPSIQKSAEWTLNSIEPRKDGLTYSWVDVSPAQKREMTESLGKAGHQFNLDPVVTLVITLPKDTIKDPRIPDSISPPLGLHEGRLYMIGTVPKQ